MTILIHQDGDELLSLRDQHNDNPCIEHPDGEHGAGAQSGVPLTCIIKYWHKEMHYNLLKFGSSIITFDRDNINLTGNNTVTKIENILAKILSVKTFNYLLKKRLNFIDHIFIAQSLIYAQLVVKFFALVIL